MENLIQNKLVALAKMNAKLDGIPYEKLDTYMKGYLRGVEDMAGIIPNLTCCVSDIFDDHEYVEIAGIKWATMNVGASSVTDYGLFFQWGDTQGYTAAQVGSGEGKSGINWENYKFYRPNCEKITKYNKHDGFTNLFFIDDAVTTAWGRNWRTPTKNEFKALYDATTHEFTRNYKCSGIAGLVFRDKVDQSKELFFPAAGYCNNGSVGIVGRYGYYWSSSLHGDIAYGYNLSFNSSDVNWQNHNYRYFGFSVRGVLSERNYSRRTNKKAQALAQGKLSKNKND